MRNTEKCSQALKEEVNLDGLDGVFMEDLK